ncbi:carboxylesterase family protein [Rhizorhabdus histidinilytica]
MFRNLDAYDWPWTAADARLSDRISAYWVNFARSGDPNGGDLPLWSRFEGSDGPAMRIGAEPAMGRPGRGERFAVLDAYYAGR